MKKNRGRLAAFAAKYQRPMVFVGLLLVIGVFLGLLYGMTIHEDKLSKTVAAVEEKLNIEALKKNDKAVFYAAFKADLIPLLLLLAMGISPLFIPLILGEVLIKGFKIGFSAGALIRLLRIKGFYVFLATTFLQNLIFIPFFICVGIFSIKNAVRFKELRKRKDKIGKRRFFIGEIIAVCGIVAVAALCGGIESFVSTKIFLPVILSRGGRV